MAGLSVVLPEHCVFLVTAMDKSGSTLEGQTVDPVSQGHELGVTATVVDGGVLDITSLRLPTPKTTKREGKKKDQRKFEGNAAFHHFAALSAASPHHNGEGIALQRGMYVQFRGKDLLVSPIDAECGEYRVVSHPGYQRYLLRQDNEPKEEVNETLAEAETRARELRKDLTQRLLRVQSKWPLAKRALSDLCTFMIQEYSTLPPEVRRFGAARLASFEKDLFKFLHEAVPGSRQGRRLYLAISSAWSLSQAKAMEPYVATFLTEKPSPPPSPLFKNCDVKTSWDWEAEGLSGDE